MRYSVVFILLSLVLAVCVAQLGRAWLLLWWLVADFLAIGIAYALRSPGLFGKRSNGTLPIWSWIVFLPYHLMNLVVWHFIRLVSQEPAANEVGASLVIGRRLLGPEISERFENFVDLTAEFQEPLGVRGQPGYICLPILDATAPALAQLESVMRKLRPGRTFIHCAQGHGRTGLVALAFLLSPGAAESVAGALRQLQGVRPAIRLNDEQYRCAEAYAAFLSKST